MQCVFDEVLFIFKGNLAHSPQWLQRFSFFAQIDFVGGSGMAGMPYVASPPITSRSSRPTPRFLRTIKRCLPVTAANQWQIRKNIYLPHPSTNMSKVWSPVNANFGIKSILAQQVQTDPEKAEPVQLEAVESVFY